MERGQAHTLEAVIAGLMLLASVIFALQMTAVTPLSASTSSQHIENQQKAAATGVLAAAAEADALKPSILYVNNSTGQFHNTSDVGYYTGEPSKKTFDTEFGRMLNRTFDQEGISYNVYLNYRTQSGNTIRDELIYRGVPSDNAVSARRSVTIVDSDRLYDRDNTRNATTVANSTHEIKDTGDVVYNVVRVEVVAWRI